MTPLINPAIPSSEKLFSGTELKMGIWRLKKESMFHMLAKRKPETQPRNKDGAKVPPQPPPLLVAVVAKTLKRMMPAR